jgi:hypothetical protein
MTGLVYAKYFVAGRWWRPTGVWTGWSMVPGWCCQLWHRLWSPQHSWGVYKSIHVWTVDYRHCPSSQRQAIVITALQIMVQWEITQRAGPYCNCGFCLSVESVFLRVLVSPALQQNICKIKTVFWNGNMYNNFVSSVRKPEISSGVSDWVYDHNMYTTEVTCFWKKFT